MRIGRQFFQPTLNTVQIAQRVTQALPAVAGNEAAIDQTAHLRLDIRQRQRHGHIDAPFQPLVDVEHRRQDLFNLFGDLYHRIVQLGAHLLVQLLEVLLLPGRTARFRHQFVDAAGDAVVNQIQHLAVRVEVEPQLGFVRQLFMQVFYRRRNIEQQQATLAAPHHFLLLLLAVEQADRYALFLVDQRRPGLDLIAAALLLVAARQIAEAPDMQAVLLQPVIRHLRQRLLHFFFQFGFQRAEIFALFQLAVMFVHHAEGHFQVIGHLFPLPVFPLQRNAGHAAELFRQRVEQRQLHGGDAAQKGVGIVRRRHQIAAQRLRQRLDQRDN